MSGKMIDIIEDLDRGINIEQLAKKEDTGSERNSTRDNDEKNRKA